jgi:acetoin utilization deacetylase AcuC-like enzyme
LADRGRENLTATCSFRCSFVYSPEYYCDIGAHVFPTEKYRLVHQALLEDGDIPAERFLAPEAASREDLLLVHTEEYVRDLFAFRHTARTRSSELPISEPIIRANLLGTGGTILCCRRALSEGLSMNLAGGFHHAFPDHAEGFCYVNDIAVAIRRIRADERAARVAVVDLDVHQGNATAFIFQSDPSVFTFSMHQENNYPAKQPGMLDVGLEDGIGDEEYLGLLDAHLPEVLDAFRPELVVYVAGVDPLAGDQLGGLALTLEGLRKRDDRVIGNCARRRIPMAGVLGGGYAQKTQDTVRAHHATCRAMWEATRNADKSPEERRKG